MPEGKRAGGIIPIVERLFFFKLIVFLFFFFLAASHDLRDLSFLIRD